MHLYNLTLQEPSAINQAITGNFSGTKHQEIIISRGTGLSLLQPNPSTGKLSTVLTVNTFGSVRCLASLRLTGGTKDYVVVCSDSGRIVVLEYDSSSNNFAKRHQETYGKSGARRTVPGQYLATDPRGRAIMVAAIEESKLVYILNRDAAANLTISSPLEAHKATTITHHIVGLDVSFENPVFAALEIDYGPVDEDPSGRAFDKAEKFLTYYELDLGLNHVVRKWSEPTDPRANMLVQVPGGQLNTTDGFVGPSGVLVCSEDHVIYRHFNVDAHRIPIPRRRHLLGDPKRPLLITAAVMHKMKGSFFHLLQNEDGDLFKVIIEHVAEEVKAIKIKYFGTIPVASALCILKSGFLFVAAEFGNHHFYQFQKLGDNDDEPEYSSTSYALNGMADPLHTLPPCYFKLRLMENLVLVDEIEATCPILDAKVPNIIPGSDTPQIFAACGRGPRSALKTLRPGLEVHAFLRSELPNSLRPNAVWSMRKSEDEAADSLIVLSFTNGTIVLSIGESIEEVRDTAFLTSTPTLAVQQFGINGLLQVHPRGVRLLQAGRVTEWEVSIGHTIVAATCNKRQVVIALSSAELVYFELDSDGQLNEYQERKALGSAILSLSVAEVPAGRLRTPFLAVGCEDQTVRIVSLDPETTLEVVSLQAVTAPPSSVCMVEMLDPGVDKTEHTMFVCIGLQNGVLLRSVLDSHSGCLLDTRSRYLGSAPVKLGRITLVGSPALVAVSSRIWLNYTHQGSVHLAPLIGDRLEHVSAFAGEICLEGLIGISGSVLRVFSVVDPGSKLKQNSLPLSYTPRKLVLDPSHRYFYVIEGDHRVYGDEIAQRKLEELRESTGMDEETETCTFEEYGRRRAPEGHWGSAIRVVDPIHSKTISLIHLEENEAAFSIAVVAFACRPQEVHLVVGTAVNVVVTPRSYSAAYLRVYKIIEDGAALELEYKTEVDDIPLSLLAFQGRLVAGVGKVLRIYDLGMKMVLRKAENKTFTSAIVALSTQGSRIIAGDMQESVHFLVYKASENRLITFADDTQPRWVTALTMVDYNTVAAGDRFGNVYVNRVDSAVSDLIDSDPTGAGMLQEKGSLMGAAHKTKLIAHFHLGDIITSIQKVSLVAGCRDVLLYTGLHGTIGVLVPSTTKEDVDFVSALEQHMRTEQISLIGRDHSSWRGYYVPVKAVVDGDLCEAYSRLSGQRQQAIATELDRSVGEVLKKLEQLRVMAGGF